MKSVSVDDFIPHLFRVVTTVPFQVIEKRRLSASNISQSIIVLFHIHGVNNVLFWPCGKKIVSYHCTGLSTCLKLPSKKHAFSVTAVKR